jgi:Kef-type K+ transport system membrane component KefB/CBS domain-containing protein
MHLDIGPLSALAVIGLAVLLGTVGGRIFEKLKIPQVVGNIVIGLILSESVLGLISRETIRDLEPFNYFALSVIGFLIGGELHRDVFKKHGRRFLIILLSEGMGAFLAVGLLVGWVTWMITGQISLAIALGSVLGAISSATAPAATVNVLWEYKTGGPLTTTVFAIVAMDDALALILFSIAAGVATMLTGQGTGGIAASLGRVGWELLGGAAFGVATGFLLNLGLKRAQDRDSSLAFTIGALAFVTGLGRMLEIDTILASMALGFTIVNLAPRRSDRSFKTVEEFAPPIFVLFFVSVGAQINFGGMAGWMWVLALVYVTARTIGKLAGANIGARLGKVAPSVRKYLGLCLFSQAGVAVGLSISASHRFSGDLGTAVIMIIALTTFIVQIIGPPSVKMAVKKAGEVGMKLTEDDLISSYRVADMVKRTRDRFLPDTSLDKILDEIAGADDIAYPIVDEDGTLMGVVSFAELRRSFMSRDLRRFLVAYDMMVPPAATVSEDTPLADALALMKKLDVEFLPVVTGDDSGKLVGMLEQREINRAISKEIMRRYRVAEGELDPESEA